MWGFITTNYFNFLCNLEKYIKKSAFKSKVGLCVIGKQENKYAKEFVEYYRGPILINTKFMTEKKLKYLKI